MRILLALCLVLIAVAGCSTEGGDFTTAAPSSTPTARASAAPTSSPSVTATNAWNATIDPAAIPLGDGKVSTTPTPGSSTPASPLPRRRRPACWRLDRRGRRNVEPRGKNRGTGPREVARGQLTATVSGNQRSSPPTTCPTATPPASSPSPAATRPTSTTPTPTTSPPNHSPTPCRSILPRPRRPRAPALAPSAS